MDIGYTDAVEGITTYLNNKDYERDLSIRTSGALRAPGPIESVQMLENMSDFAKKVEFVRNMLIDQSVTVLHKNTTLVAFQVTEGMRLEDVEYFAQRPGVFQFVIDAVFGIFLKNLYPLSSESRKAE